MNVYVVMGTSGEYSDRREWVITAYTSEDAAKAHVEKATADDRSARVLAADDDGYIDDPSVLKNPWDCRDPDWDAPNYWVETVELRDGDATPVREAQP